MGISKSLLEDTRHDERGRWEERAWLPNGRSTISTPFSGACKSATVDRIRLFVRTSAMRPLSDIGGAAADVCYVHNLAVPLRRIVVIRMTAMHPLAGIRGDTIADMPGPSRYPGPSTSCASGARPTIFGTTVRSGLPRLYNHCISFSGNVRSCLSDISG